MPVATAPPSAAPEPSKPTGNLAGSGVEKKGETKTEKHSGGAAMSRIADMLGGAAALKVAEDRASGLQAQLKEVKAAVEVAQRVLREQVGQRSHSRRRVAVQHDSKP